MFNGITSESLGIINVNVGSGLLEEPFHATRQIVKQRIRGNPVSYLLDIQDEPLVFPVTFAFKENYTEDQIREVARTLFINKYAPLTFSENLNRLFYGVFIGDFKLLHNGAKQGYIELQFECNSSYAYTPVYQSPVYDYSSNPIGGTNYIFENVGDLPTKPTITVEIVSGASFSITNNTNGGKKLEFTGLAVGEILTIDCEAESIESSIPATYRYSNMTSDSKFLSMVYGNNNLLIKGNIKIQWKWQSPLLQG